MRHRHGCSRCFTHLRPSAAGGAPRVPSCSRARAGPGAATWGVQEDAPDYISFATIRAFDPPRRLLLTDSRYHARTGSLPFQADFSTEFTVADHAEGALLRVVQDGFPCAAVAEISTQPASAAGWTPLPASADTWPRHLLVPEVRSRGGQPELLDHPGNEQPGAACSSQG